MLVSALFVSCFPEFKVMFTQTGWILVEMIDMVHLETSKLTLSKIPQKQTTKSYHRPDPSFTYLLSLLLFLTSLLWGPVYTHSLTSTLHITLVFIFIHFLLLSLVTATLFYFLVGRLLGGNSVLGRRRRGLYDIDNGEGGGEGELEFGYCWDVAIRAFVPVWFFCYGVGFFLMPVVGGEHWYVYFFSNTSYTIPIFLLTLAPINVGSPSSSATHSTFSLSTTISSSPFSDTTPCPSYTTPNFSLRRSL